MAIIPAQIGPGATLADLPTFSEQFEEDTIGMRVVSALQRNPDLPGVIVRRIGGEPTVVSRQIFFQELSIQYSREVYLGRPISIFIRSRCPQPLRLAATCPINDAVTTALQRQQAAAYEPLLVEWEAGRVALLDMRVLLQAQSQLLAATHVAMLQNEKLASVGQLAAGVAHEINNPLAFVINNNAIVRRDLAAVCKLMALYQRADGVVAAHEPALRQEIDALIERIDLSYTVENLQETLKRSAEGLRRIERIVQDLREFVRLDRNDYNTVDLNAGIESTVNMIRHRAQERQIELVLDLKPLPQIPCLGDRMNQVFLNLISNAIDASAGGASVNIHSHIQDGDACVEVVDSGCGIDPQIRNRIFEPFFTTKPIGQGSGLGLSISYGIVKQHGGKIEFESHLGRGSTFRVRLPAKESPVMRSVSQPA